MPYTRLYFKLVIFAIFLLQTCFGQTTCFPLYGSDANHPNGLFVQLTPQKTYSGAKQNSTPTYIVGAGFGSALLWDAKQGPAGFSGSQIVSTVKSELAACVPAPANPNTTPPQSVPFTNTPLTVSSHIVAISDFNRDGFADVVVVTPGGNQVALYLGKLDGSFQDPVYIKPGNASTKLSAIAVADFNGDKKVDLAVVDGGNNVVYVLFGRGDGTFSGNLPQISIPVGKSPSNLTIADINNDTFSDIVVTNSADNTISVVRGNGDGTFIPASTFAVGKNPVAVIGQDINGDGLIDLVVADAGSSDIAELYGNGNGSFQTATINKAPAPPTFLASADFNNDGKPDVVALSQDLNAVMMFLGGFQGKLTLAGAFLVPNLSASFAVNDYDGDGNLDLLVPDTDTGSPVLLLGRGDGTLNAPSVYGGTNGSTSLAAGDFNNDGKLDLVVTGSNAATSTLSLLSGMGNGQFQAPVNIPVSGHTDFVAVGDFNKDGRLDIAVSGAQLNILLGQTNGTFQQGAQYSNLTPTIVADLNKDGRLDLAGPFNGGIGVMLGNGDGTFRSPMALSAGSNPKTAVSADFNVDGAPDIAVLNAGTPGSSADPGGITILLGNGTGSFPKASTLAAGFNPKTMAAADVNGDGKPDLIVATGIDAAGSGYQISVFLGKGDGTFAAPFAIQTPAGETPNTLAIVDVDGDGNPDIILGDCCSDGTTAYFRGNGDGTFQPAMPFYGGNNVRAIVSGDWNGDGKPDLALAYSPSGNLGIGAVAALPNRLANVQAVVNTSGASFLPGPIAPDSIVAAFGNNLTTDTAAATGSPSSLPTVLAGTTVMVRDSKGVSRQAQLYYVSPKQINYLVPAATALGPAKVIVTAPNGVTTTQVNVISTSPGLFTVNVRGLAAGNGVLVTATSQSIFNLSYYDATVGANLPLPINMGTRLNHVFLTLFGTGFRNRASLDNVSVYLNGVFTPALYAAAQAEYPGLDQLNFEIPQSFSGTNGVVTIQLIVNGVMANPVFVTVQ
jgi:uncharacterized protein (TIGR03437 family)